MAAQQVQQAALGLRLAMACTCFSTVFRLSSECMHVLGSGTCELCLQALQHGCQVSKAFSCSNQEPCQQTQHRCCAPLLCLPEPQCHTCCFKFLSCFPGLPLFSAHLESICTFNTILLTVGAHPAESLRGELIRGADGSHIAEKGLQHSSHAVRSYHGLARLAQELQALRLLVAALWPCIQLGDLTCL